MNDIVINKISIPKGIRTTIMLPMPKLYDATPLSIPVHVLRSNRPGPVLCVTAAIHGDEINGVEIIRRFMKKISLKQLAGTLICVPVVNVYGFLYQTRYLMDRRDLNRSFPGSQQGSLGSRLAHLILNEIIVNATHIIDLHTGSLQRYNLPQIRASFDIPRLKKLALNFPVPVVLEAKGRIGSLRQYAENKGIPCLLYEAGEALRFDELSIRMGVRGIFRILNALRMLPRKKLSEKKINATIAHTSYWVRAAHSGILNTYKSEGKTVNEGEVLGIIANPMNGEEHELLSPLSGIIIGCTRFPLVHEGAALYHIACFESLEKVSKQIEVLETTYGSLLASDTEIDTL